MKPNKFIITRHARKWGFVYIDEANISSPAYFDSIDDLFDKIKSLTAREKKFCDHGETIVIPDGYKCVKCGRILGMKD